MGRITRLPVELANQIAAGEVVERPASVVKELLENALDAGARHLAVTVEQGGKQTIRVEDDGDGMEPDDAQLAVERHATSKIARAEDLAAITTLGFRGEALPSIASVSHFVLRTRRRGQLSGTEIRVNGGAIAGVVEVGLPEGTVVSVTDLFYNLPARRKFLKADAAEAAQVSKLVTQMALAYPGVGFTLTSSGRHVLRCPPVAGFAERFYQLFGERPDLVAVGKEAGGIRVSGLVAKLAEQGPTRGAQNVFVNRRIVKDKTIAHAIIDAYSASTIKERSPEVHLFLEMAPDMVDVNVHPTKAEVRFRYQSLVHEVVKRAVSAALGTGAVPELQLSGDATKRIDVASTASLPGLLASFGYRPDGRPAAGDPGWSTSPAGPPEAPAGVALATGAAAGAERTGEAAGERIRPLIPLGQFRDTFIIAVDDEGISIIDQHVAHERVLFERVMEQLTRGRLDGQRLLEPLLVDLPPAARQALASHHADLDRVGFEIEDFGGGSVRVLAVPAMLTAAESTLAVRALAEDLEGLDRGGRIEDALRRIAATTACHAAVKANFRLTTEKMVHILDELRRTAYSTVCPHGRPVMLRLTRREVERNFQRI